jgi:spore germination cell wall hydrolase CwlJ-like protein
MSYKKMGYYKVITSLVGIILLLILYIVIIPPKVEIKEVEVEKEIIVEVAKEPTYKYNITSAEREMLARLVYREANIESLECQMAVVSVVINRWQDGRWEDTLEDVIYSPYQFTPANLLYKTTPTELNYTAVDLVLQNGCTMPPYVMYFRADHHFNWEGYKPYTQIDLTCFGYFVADQNN